MKFNVKNKTLLAAIKQIKDTIEKRTTIKVLGYYRVEAVGSLVTFTATNLDHESVVSVHADIEVEGVDVIPAASLLDAIKSLPAKEVTTLAWDRIENPVAKILCSGFEKICALECDHEDFPIMARDAHDNSFVIDAAVFMSMISDCIIAVSKNDMQAHLCGCYLTQKAIDGVMNLRMIATNGHKLVDCYYDAPAGVNFPDYEVDPDRPRDRIATKGLIIPTDTMKALLAAKPIGDLTISYNTDLSRVAFKSFGFAMLSKVIDGTFVNADRVLSKINESCQELGETESITFCAKSFKEALAIIAPDKSAVAFEAEGNELVMSCRKHDESLATRRIPLFGFKGFLKFGYNGKYLAELAKLTEGMITLAVPSQSDPGRFAFSDKPRTDFILMPMRVN